MDKRKKVQVWLSPMEFKVLSDYCERNGVSFYSVLKDGMNRIILGEGASQEPSLNTEQKVQGKRDTGVALPISPSQISPISQESKEGQALAWLQKRIDKMEDHDQLWNKINELTAGLAELKGLVSGLLLRLTKTEELEDKLDGKIRDTVVTVIKGIRNKALREAV